MPTTFVLENTDDRTLVGASNGDNEYILWSVSNDSPTDIYFEWDNQLNAGYNIVSEVTIDGDGCHVVANGRVISIYWNPPQPERLHQFVAALDALYGSGSGVVVVN